MTIYFSPSAADGRGGFFDNAVHGTRRISVIDLAKQAKAMSRAIERDEADYLAALEAAIDAPAEAQPIRDHFTRREMAASDNPVTRLAENPDCRIPADAVEVSDDEYRRLMTAQAEGMEIVASADGPPIARARLTNPADVVANVRKLRDRALAASDWTELPSAAERLDAAKREAWAEHRQRLRDLPADVEAVFANGGITAVSDWNAAELMPVSPDEHRNEGEKA